MKVILNVIASLAIVSSGVAGTDCTLPRSVLTLFTSDNLTSRERRLAGGEAIEHLFSSCSKGPSDHASRTLFFEVVDLAYTTGKKAGQFESNPDRSEAAWEGANQFEYDLREYMDRIVNEKDVEFKSVILKTANARAISRLGPDAKYDVLRMVHIADPVTIGAGHHSAYPQAILALGCWIDPAEERFTADDKREMTDLLLAKAAAYAERVDYDQTANAEATLKALGHATSPEALPALQKWMHSQYPSLREAAQAGTTAVKARLQRRDQ